MKKSHSMWGQEGQMVIFLSCFPIESHPSDLALHGERISECIIKLTCSQRQNCLYFLFVVFISQRTYQRARVYFYCPCSFIPIRYMSAFLFIRINQRIPTSILKVFLSGLIIGEFYVLLFALFGSIKFLHQECALLV